MSPDLSVPSAGVLFPHPDAGLLALLSGRPQPSSMYGNGVPGTAGEVRLEVLGRENRCSCCDWKAIADCGGVSPIRASRVSVPFHVRSQYLVHPVANEGSIHSTLKATDKLLDIDRGLTVLFQLILRKLKTIVRANAFGT